MTKKQEQLNANIWKFYITRIIGNFEFITAIFVLYLLANNLTMTEVLILQSFFTILIFLLEVPSGVIADLFGLKRTLIISELCIIIGFILYGLFSTFATFMIAEFFVALGWALYSGADSAFIYDTLKQMKKETLFKKIMGKVNGFGMLSTAASAFLGGYLASLLGLRNMFFISTIFFSICLLVLLTLKEPKQYKKTDDKKYFKHLKEGLTYSKNHPEIKKYIIYFSLFGALTYMLFFLIQPYFQNGGLSLTIIGFGVSGYFLSNALGYHLTHKISNWIKNTDRILITLLFTTGILFIALKFVNVWIGMLIMFLIMFISSIKELLVDHEVNTYCKDSHRATILSVKNMSKSLLYTLFGPVVGYITDIFSLKISLIVMGTTLIIFGIYILILFNITNKKKK